MVSPAVVTRPCKTPGQHLCPLWRMPIAASRPGRHGSSRAGLSTAGLSQWHRRLKRRWSVLTPKTPPCRQSRWWCRSLAPCRVRRRRRWWRCRRATCRKLAGSTYPPATRTGLSRRDGKRDAPGEPMRSRQEPALHGLLHAPPLRLLAEKPASFAAERRPVWPRLLHAGLSQ